MVPLRQQLCCYNLHSYQTDKTHSLAHAYHNLNVLQLGSWLATNCKHELERLCSFCPKANGHEKKDKFSSTAGNTIFIILSFTIACIATCSHMHNYLLQYHSYNWLAEFMNTCWNFISDDRSKYFVNSNQLVIYLCTGEFMLQWNYKYCMVTFIES